MPLHIVQMPLYVTRVGLPLLLARDELWPVNIAILVLKTSNGNGKYL